MRMEELMANFSKYEFVKKYEEAKGDEIKKAELIADSIKEQEDSIKKDYVTKGHFDQTIENLDRDLKKEIEICKKDVRSQLVEMKAELMDALSGHLKWNYALSAGIIAVLIKQVYF